MLGKILPSQTCSAALSSWYRIHPTCSVGCLSAAQPHPSSKCKREGCYKEHFCHLWNCKQASAAHPSSTAHINQGMQLLTGHWLITIGRQQDAETFQYVFLHSFSWNRRGRLNKPLLELMMHIFQGMGIAAYKGDFEAYKLEWISLGANQEKKRAYLHRDCKERWT